VKKPAPTATPSTTNPTWTDLGSSPILRFERLAINSLSHGKALKGSASTKQYLKIQTLTQKKHTVSLLQRYINWCSLENNRLLRPTSRERHNTRCRENAHFKTIEYVALIAVIMLYRVNPEVINNARRRPILYKYLYRCLLYIPGTRCLFVGMQLCHSKCTRSRVKYMKSQTEIRVVTSPHSRIKRYSLILSKLLKEP